MPFPTISTSSGRGCRRRTGSCIRPARCSFTSTTGKSTTARSCWIRSLAGTPSSTKSSGRTTTGDDPGNAGRPSTTTSSGTRKTPRDYTYRYEDIDRIPYMAPALVGPKKAARGKTPTDTWWQTVVSPTGKEKTGLPDPEAAGDPGADREGSLQTPGTGCSTFSRAAERPGEAAVRAGRSAVLIDSHPDAVRVMRKRLAFAKPTLHGVKQASSRKPSKRPSGRDELEAPGRP